MKIKFKNPNSLKYGTIEHMENSVARTLIAMGEAEAVPYTGYVQRLSEESALRTKTAAGDAVPEFFTAPTWNVKQHQRSGKVVVEKRAGTELTTFDGPPSDCPENVRRAFAALVGAPDKTVADYFAREKAVRDQAEYNERIKAARRY